MSNIMRITAEHRRVKAELSNRLLPAITASSYRHSFGISPVPNLNVVGVGIGEKVQDGRRTGDLAIKVFVRLKYPQAEIPEAAALPSVQGGMPVDVEEIGFVRSFQNGQSTDNPREKLRPARPGCSIGYSGTIAMAGTFGCLVRRASDKTVLILSNNHVLARENQLPKGSEICQPGLLDGGVPSNDGIAVLDSFVPLNPNAANKVDAALAIPSGNTLVEKEVIGIGVLSGSKPAELDMQVRKYGRTTGYTTGYISSLDTDIVVEYANSKYLFQNQIIVRSLDAKAFGLEGDSGAVVVQKDEGKVVGLLFGGSDSHAIVNHIEDVLGELNVELV